MCSQNIVDGNWSQILKNLLAGQSVNQISNQMPIGFPTRDRPTMKRHCSERHLDTEHRGCIGSFSDRQQKLHLNSLNNLSADDEQPCHQITRTQRRIRSRWTRLRWELGWGCASLVTVSCGVCSFCYSLAAVNY